jgi:hypothetical protein
MLREMSAREFTTWSVYHQLKAEQEKRGALDRSVEQKLEARKAKG